MLLHFSYLELSVEGVSIAVSGEDDIVHGWIICRDGGTERGILCRVSPSLVLTDSPSLPPQPAEAHPPTLSQKCPTVCLLVIIQHQINVHEGFMFRT